MADQSKSNYLQQLNESEDAVDYRDYSLSNNNLTADGLLSLIKSIKPEKLCELITKYPDCSYKNLKLKICSYYNVSNIVLGCGSEELIVRINNCFNIEDKRIGLLAPNFYRIKETAERGFVFQIKYSDESCYYNLDNCMNVDLVKDVDALWVTNPNPIIGKICQFDYLSQLIKNNPEVIFVVDESAMDLVKKSSQFSLLELSERVENLIVLRSFSKLFGLAGLRVGFATGSMKFLSKIEKMGATFPVNNFADFILCEMLNSKDFAKEILFNIHKNKQQIEEILMNKLGLKLSTSVTNCVFVKTKDSDIHEKFKDVGIIPLDLKHQEGILDSAMIRVTIHGSNTLFECLFKKISKICKVRN